METGEGEGTRDVRRPMNAFLIFCKRHRSIVRERNPRLDNRSVTRILGELWAELDAGEKGAYIDLANQYKDAFLKANPDYKWHHSDKPPPVSALRPSLHPSLSTHRLSASQSETITLGKLADPTEMGGLNQLLTSDHTTQPSASHIEVTKHPILSSSAAGMKRRKSDSVNPSVTPLWSSSWKREKSASESGAIARKSRADVAKESPTRPPHSGAEWRYSAHSLAHSSHTKDSAHAKGSSPNMFFNSVAVTPVSDIKVNRVESRVRPLGVSHNPRRKPGIQPPGSTTQRSDVFASFPTSTLTPPDSCATPSTQWGCVAPADTTSLPDSGRDGLGIASQTDVNVMNSALMQLAEMCTSELQRNSDSGTQNPAPVPTAHSSTSLQPCSSKTSALSSASVSNDHSSKEGYTANILVETCQSAGRNNEVGQLVQKKCYETNADSDTSGLESSFTNDLHLARKSPKKFITSGQMLVDHIIDRLFSVEREQQKVSDSESFGSGGSVPDDGGKLPDVSGKFPDDSGKFPDDSGKFPVSRTIDLDCSQKVSNGSGSFFRQVGNDSGIAEKDGDRFPIRGRISRDESGKLLTNNAISNYDEYAALSESGNLPVYSGNLQSGLAAKMRSIGNENSLERSGIRDERGDNLSVKKRGRNEACHEELMANHARDDSRREGYKTEGDLIGGRDSTKTESRDCGFGKETSQLKSYSVADTRTVEACHRTVETCHRSGGAVHEERASRKRERLKTEDATCVGSSGSKTGFIAEKEEVLVHEHRHPKKKFLQDDGQGFCETLEKVQYNNNGGGSARVNCVKRDIGRCPNSGICQDSLKSGTVVQSGATLQRFDPPRHDRSSLIGRRTTSVSESRSLSWMSEKMKPPKKRYYSVGTDESDDSVDYSVSERQTWISRGVDSGRGNEVKLSEARVEARPACGSYISRLDVSDEGRRTNGANCSAGEFCDELEETMGARERLKHPGVFHGDGFSGREIGRPRGSLSTSCDQSAAQLHEGNQSSVAVAAAIIKTRVPGSVINSVTGEFLSTECLVVRGSNEESRLSNRSETKPSPGKRKIEENTKFAGRTSKIPRNDINQSGDIETTLVTNDCGETKPSGHANLDESMTAVEKVRKSKRRNRGQRYMELINEGIIQPSKERLAVIRTESASNDEKRSDRTGGEAPRSVCASDPREEGGRGKMERRYVTGGFDLEAHIATLPPCSVESLSKRRGRGTRPTPDSPTKAALHTSPTKSRLDENHARVSPLTVACTPSSRAASAKHRTMRYAQNTTIDVDTGVRIERCRNYHEPSQTTASAPARTTAFSTTSAPLVNCPVTPEATQGSRKRKARRRAISRLVPLSTTALSAVCPESSTPTLKTVRKLSPTEAIEDVGRVDVGRCPGDTEVGDVKQLQPTTRNIEEVNDYTSINMRGESASNDVIADRLMTSACSDIIDPRVASTSTGDVIGSCAEAVVCDVINSCVVARSESSVKGNLIRSSSGNFAAKNTRSLLDDIIEKGLANDNISANHMSRYSGAGFVNDAPASTTTGIIAARNDDVRQDTENMNTLRNSAVAENMSSDFVGVTNCKLGADGGMRVPLPNVAPRVGSEVVSYRGVTQRDVSSRPHESIAPGVGATNQRIEGSVIAFSKPESRSTKLIGLLNTKPVLCSRSCGNEAMASHAGVHLTGAPVPGRLSTQCSIGLCRQMDGILYSMSCCTSDGVRYSSGEHHPGVYPQVEAMSGNSAPGYKVGPVTYANVGHYGSGPGFTPVYSGVGPHMYTRLSGDKLPVPRLSTGFSAGFTDTKATDRPSGRKYSKLRSELFGTPGERTPPHDGVTSSSTGSVDTGAVSCSSAKVYDDARGVFNAAINNAIDKVLLFENLSDNRERTPHATAATMCHPETIAAGSANGAETLISRASTHDPAATVINRTGNQPTSGSLGIPPVPAGVSPARGSLASHKHQTSAHDDGDLCNDINGNLAKS